MLHAYLPPKRKEMALIQVTAMQNFTQKNPTSNINDRKTLFCMREWQT